MQDSCCLVVLELRCQQQGIQINPDVELPFPYNLSHWQLISWLEREGGVQVTYIDCCINGCQAYTGDKADDEICRESRCKEPRYRPVSQSSALAAGEGQWLQG
jgi:hypothetical protein